MLGNPVPVATLSKEIMLPRKRACDDLKSSDKCVIVFILQVMLWVLEYCYLQTCQPVYPPLLENARLLFWYFSSICWMGRTDKKVVWSGSSESQFISVHMRISVSHWQKPIFAAANCIALLSKVYGLVCTLGINLRLAYRLKLYIRKLYVRRKDESFSLLFLARILMHLVSKTGNVIKRNCKKGVLFNTSLGVPSGLLGTLPCPASQENGGERQAVWKL